MSANIKPGSLRGNRDYLDSVVQGKDGLWLVQTYVVRVRFSDFSDADTSQALSLNTLKQFPTDVWVMRGTYHYLAQVFAGGDIATAEISLVGDLSTGTESIIDAVDVFTGSALGVRFDSVADGSVTDYAADLDPVLQLDTTVGAINTATSGVVDIVIPYMRGLAHRSL